MAMISAVDAGGQDLVHFLDLIGWSEGCTTHPLTKNDGYDVIVTGVGGQAVFDTYVDHPFSDGRPSVIVRRVPLLRSTASGRYQILLKYWHAYKLMLHLPDFSPLSQDKVGLQYLKECKAISAILNRDIQTAISLCSSRWASFPGNKDGQGGKSITALLGQWTKLVS